MPRVTAPEHPSLFPGVEELKHLLTRILATTDDLAALPLRVALGVMIFPHALQKVSGLFGGYGIAATLDSFHSMLGIPYALGVLDILAEFFGGIALILGLGTRIAALAVGVVMVVAVLLVHLPFGFFMNWMGNQKGEGIEFHLLALGIAIALIIKGGGRYSIDRKLTS